MRRFLTLSGYSMNVNVSDFAVAIEELQQEVANLKERLDQIEESA